MTPHPQQEDPADILYICSLEDLNCLHDYFMAAVNGEDLTAIPRLWNQQIGIIRSRKTFAPAAPCLPNTPLCDDCYKDKIIHDKELAATIRNQTLDEIKEKIWSKCFPPFSANIEYQIVSWDTVKELIESLRTQEHQRGDQR